MPATRFLGVDLAWSARGGTGLAAGHATREGLRVTAHGIEHGPEAVARWVLDHAGPGPAVVAVDAPLAVPNEAGRRPADALLSAAFHPYHAGVYPANRAWLRKLAGDDVLPGERLVRLLAEQGFRESVEPRADARAVCEVYPHAAIVELFQLPRILKYKKGPRPARLRELRRLQAHLAGMAVHEPRMVVDGPLLALRPSLLRGRALKHHEDRLDALVCAYTGYLRWRAPARTHVFGDLATGHIVTPASARTRARMGSHLRASAGVEA